MYDVLIVDDEPLARQSLRYLIDWEAHGFRIGAEAEDGLQALELMKERYFALVLTDIRMPRLGGLAFIERLRAFSEAPAVILSGYDDFEYAREGIRLGVHEYLLKPVDEDDLSALLRRVGGELAERSRLGRRQRSGMSAYRDAYLRKAAQGALGAKELADGAALAGVDWQGKRLCVLLAELDLWRLRRASTGEPEREADGSADAGGGPRSEREAELKRYAVRNIVEELCAGEACVYEESEDRLGIVVAADAEAQLADEALTAKAAALVESVRAYAKEAIAIGIGTPVSDAAALRSSFDAAERALDGRFLQGEGAVFKPVARPERREDEHDWRAFDERLDALLGAVRSCDGERMDETIASLRREAAEAAIGAERLRLEALGLLVRLYQTAKQAGVDPESLFDRRQRDYEATMRARTIEELFGFLRAKCEDVLQSIRVSREWKPNKAAAAVIEMIEREYASNISLGSAAKRIYLNPNYLGKLFKASTGRSFNEYLLEVRMEKAKELLLHSDLRIYEIAQQVGYEELDWFYKKFKAYAEVSAGEFRARAGKPRETGS